MKDGIQWCRAHAKFSCQGGLLNMVVLQILYDSLWCIYFFSFSVLFYFMTYFIYRNNSKQSYSLILIKSILLLFLNIYAHAAFHLHGEVIIKDGDFFMSWLERGSSNLVNLMSCFSVKDLRSLIRVSVSCRFTSSCAAASFCSLSLKISSAQFSRWLVHSRSFFFSSSRRAWCHPGKACRSVLRL